MTTKAKTTIASIRRHRRLAKRCHLARPARKKNFSKKRISSE